MSDETEATMAPNAGGTLERLRRKIGTVGVAIVSALIGAAIATALSLAVFDDEDHQDSDHFPIPPAPATSGEDSTEGAPPPPLLGGDTPVPLDECEQAGLTNGGSRPTRKELEAIARRSEECLNRSLEEPQPVPAQP